MSLASSTYPSEDEKLLINEVETLMEETMKKYDPSHDALHVNRVRRTALALAKTLTPTPDLLVIELAALMHDLLDKKYVSPEQYADPYAFFLPFFQQLNAERGISVAENLIQDGRLKLITKIVENVSWTTEKKLIAQGGIEEWHKSCKELHCVQDADRLDGIGGFGAFFTSHPSIKGISSLQNHR
ncbi:hypothetical protein FRC02_008190 [Tulasnella sp. 418]|nr:hypothetical protein FRC02_008190 [Tulasnella sp. 418]